MLYCHPLLQRRAAHPRVAKWRHAADDRECEDIVVSPDHAPGTERLLLRTRNSGLWAAEVTDFRKEYVALTDDAASWIEDQDIRLIGVDYFSVQGYNESPLTHQILLGAGVVIVEGLNLADVQPGTYEFVCLPFGLVGAEAAPPHAVLRYKPAVDSQRLASWRNP